MRRGVTASSAGWRTMRAAASALSTATLLLPVRAVRPALRVSSFWLVANHHLPSLAALGPKARAHLADCLRRGAAAGGTEVSAAHNLVLFYGFAGGDFHLHLEFVPRFARAVRAGLELSTGYSVLSRTPGEHGGVLPRKGRQCVRTRLTSRSCSRPVESGM